MKQGAGMAMTQPGVGGAPPWKFDNPDYL